MATDTETLEWLESGLLEVERGDKHVTVEPEGSATELVFGSVPDGWTVTVRGWGNRSRALHADSVGRNVTWRLEAIGQQPARLIGQFRTVELRGASRQPRLELETNTVKFILGEGQYTIDGSGHTYRLESKPSKGSTQINGSAAVKDIRGEGTLDLRAAIDPGAAVNSFSGSITVNQEVTGLQLDAPDAQLTLNQAASRVKGLVAQLVTRSQLTDSDIRVASRALIHGDIEDSIITVLEPLTGQFAIEIGQSNRRAAQRPTASRCLIQCEGPGDVSTGPLIQTRISTSGNLTVQGPVEWSGEPPSADVIHAGNIDISGQVSLADRSPITSRGTLQVQGVTGGVIDAGESMESEKAITRSVVTTGHFRAGAAIQSSIIECGSCELIGETDESTQLTITGPGEIKAKFDGKLSWIAPEDGELRVDADVDHLTVEGSPSDGPALLACGERVARIRSLEVDRKVQLLAEGKDPLCIGEVQLSNRMSPLVINSTRSIEIQSIRAGHGVLSIQGKAGASLMLLDVERLELAAMASVSIGVEDEARTPSLQLTGPGPFQVSSEVRAVDARSSPPDWLPEPKESAAKVPLVQVKDSGAILALTGEFRLGQLDGRIACERDDQGEPAKLRTIVEQEDKESGILTGVDPTPLDYVELDLLRGLQVFEPDGRALIDAAKESGLDRFETRSLAHKMDRIAEVVKGRAISGTSKSGAMWAAARTHHAAADHWLESGARWIHRGLGYSQRPLPAMATYMSLVLALTLLLVAFEEPPLRGDPLSFWGQLGRVVFLPVSLLRLPDLGGGPIFDNTTLHLVAFVVLGVPLVFLVIAIRHFLASPVERS